MSNTTTKQTVTPTVGMGATEIMWTDRHPFTVIEVRSKTTIVVQRDTAVRTDKRGMDEDQDYTFERDVKGEVVILTLRKDGKWKSRGDGRAFHIGSRREFHDYSF